MSLFYRNTTSKKIVILVGERGALCLLMTGSVIDERSFIDKEAAETQIRYLKSLIYSNPNAMVYMALNNEDQKYTSQIMPAVNRLSVTHLINIKLENSFARYEIKKAMLLHEEEENKNLRYIFMASKLNSLTKKLLDLITKNSKNFQGILLLPIEMVYVIKKLEERNNQSSKWNILISYTKTNDFRQLILKEGVVISTNIITSEDDLTPDIISGKLYQEIQNSIEYLAKFDFNKNDSLSIYAIVPNEVKTSLLTTKLTLLNSYILTPYELAKSLSIEQDILLNDKSSDSIILCLIFKNIHNILCHTKETKLFSRLSVINTYLGPIMARMITILFMINSLFVFNINYNLKKKIL